MSVQYLWYNIVIGGIIMDQNTFIGKVQNKEIKNGTKFKVYNQDKLLIGTVGVIDATIVYLDMPVIPDDILVGSYIFEEVKEEQ